jgi:hypothetical protein
VRLNDAFFDTIRYDTTDADADEVFNVTVKNGSADLGMCCSVPVAQHTMMLCRERREGATESGVSGRVKGEGGPHHHAQASKLQLKRA